MWALAEHHVQPVAAAPGMVGASQKVSAPVAAACGHGPRPSSPTRRRGCQLSRGTPALPLSPGRGAPAPLHPRATKRCRLACGLDVQSAVDGAALDTCDEHAPRYSLTDCGALFLFRIVEGDGVGDRLGLHVLAADLERRALLGIGHLEAGDAHALLGQLRIAGAGDDADLLAVGPDLVAHVGRLLVVSTSTPKILKRSLPFSR